MAFPRTIKTGNERFPALTGIRAMGAAAVFFVHLPFEFGYKLVVDVMAFFFVLSGFLIIYLYYENIAVKSWRLRQYFVNRFARIYPVYFLLVTIVILLGDNFRMIYLFKNYSLTHALFYNMADRAIQPSWSITVEECFYLLAPIVMFLVRRYNYLFALLFGASLLGIALFISTLPVSFIHTPHMVYSITFFGHFFEFFCGIFLALLILKKEKIGPVEISGIKFTIAGVAGILISIGILIASKNMNDPNMATQSILINNFILPIPVALLYYGLICEKSLLSGFLSLKPILVAGRTSYTFYLLHMIVIELIAVPFIAPYFEGFRNLYVLTIFILTQFIAWLIFVYYEEPLNILIRKKFTTVDRKKTTVNNVLV